MEIKESINKTFNALTVPEHLLNWWPQRCTGIPKENEEYNFFAYSKIIHSMKNSKIIFFDGICNFCNVTVDFVWKRNKRRNLYYASLQSDIVKEKLMKRGINDLKLRTIYYDDGDRIYQKSQAIFMILTTLDGIFYPLLGKIALIFPRIISDYLYDIISKNRYHIMGKRDSCRIPSIEEEEYFL